MRTIYKYTIRPDQIREEFTLELPKDAIVLSFGLQREVMLIWVQIETDNLQMLEHRRFGIFGTGNHIAETALQFIGTVQFTFGLVWHLFEYIIP